MSTIILFLIILLLGLYFYHLHHEQRKYNPYFIQREYLRENEIIRKNNNKINEKNE